MIKAWVLFEHVDGLLLFPFSGCQHHLSPWPLALRVSHSTSYQVRSPKIFHANPPTALPTNLKLKPLHQSHAQHKPPKQDPSPALLHPRSLERLNPLPRQTPLLPAPLLPGQAFALQLRPCQLLDLRQCRSCVLGRVTAVGLVAGIYDGPVSSEFGPLCSKGLDLRFGQAPFGVAGGGDWGWESGHCWEEEGDEDGKEARMHFRSVLDVRAG